MDLSFASPPWLWALALLPLLALLEARAMGRAARAMRQLAGARAPNALLEQVEPRERRTGAWLHLGALALFVLGAAGPQWGRETVRRTSRGSDLVFAVDVSASMDVRDVAPSRMDEARREALALLERVEGSRVGVLAFAGDAVRLCPLTLDHAAARLTLETVESGSVSSPGTDIGRALESALAMMPAGRRDDQAIVLWTDGEDLEGHATAAIERLRGTGVRVFTVGVGTPAGDLVPVLDEQGRPVDLKRAEGGGVIRSQLDERLLRELARATRGAYFPAVRAGGELPRLAAAVGTLARGRRGARLVERPVARFPLFAALAILLLAADQVRPRRRLAPAPAGAGAVRRHVAAAAIALVFAAPPARAASDWTRGDAAFRAGAWARAETLYARRARRGAPAAVEVNLATARARRGLPPTDWDGALERLGASAGRAGTAARYNRGTLLAEHRDWEAALASLRGALERDPGDADARWNYEYALRERQREESPPKPQPSPQRPQPSAGGQQPQSQPQGQPPPEPQSAPSQAAGAAPPPQAAGTPAGMTRQQAEQLLGSLQELERLEKQRAKRSPVTQERKGKDW